MTDFARTDNPAIRVGLDAMRQMVAAHGGHVHPAACIEERGGQFRVLCDTQEQGSLLFRMPDKLLVPLDGLGWHEQAGSIALARGGDRLDPDQAELLDIFLSIYNSAGKLELTRRQAVFAVTQDAEFATRVGQVRPATPGVLSSAFELFFETRTYSSGQALFGLAHRPCIMPLIDFTNHHCRGAPYRHGQGWLATTTAFPADDQECFIDYGMRSDPLDLALSHGFLDRDVPYANSVPAALDLPGFGRLDILGTGEVSNHKANPPKIQFTDDGLVLSYFQCDVRNPHHAKSTLQLAMMASGRRRGISEAVVARALAEVPAAIVAANREKLQAFSAYLATRQDLHFAPQLADASLCLLDNFEKAFAGWQ